MFQTPLFSLSKTIKNNQNNLKIKNIQINLDNIFAESSENSKDYLKYKSIEDLEINELKNVINSNDSMNLLCESALISSTNTLVDFQEEKKSKHKSDLNILAEQNIQFNIEEKETIIYNKIKKGSKVDTKNRKRKSEDQVQYLEKEFKKNPFWNKDKITELSKNLGLSFYQVYKWKWDNSFMI